MAKIVLNSRIEPDIEPLENDIYKFRYPGGIVPFSLRISNLLTLTALFKKISDDLRSRYSGTKQIHWQYLWINSKESEKFRRQVKEKIMIINTTLRVLCIQTDEFEVVFESPAFEALLIKFWLTKIISYQQQPSQKNFLYPIESKENTTLHMLINTHEKRFWLVDENEIDSEGNPKKVSFQLHTLAELCTYSSTIISDLKNLHIWKTLYYLSIENRSINRSRRGWGSDTPYNVLNFENYINQNGTSHRVNVEIRDESTFRNMLKHATNLDFFLSDTVKDGLEYELTCEKSIEFSADGQYFTTLNNRYELDILPTTALNALLQQREQITTFFNTGVGRDTGNYGTVYWSNEAYTIQAGYYSDIEKNVLRFIRNENYSWFFVITEPTFTKLLDLYEEKITATA